MQRLTGWVAKYPFLLKEIPKHQRDLVWKIEGIWADEPLDSQFATKQEALDVVCERLVEMREQARANLAFLSKTYTTASGATYYCTQALEEEWRAEERRNLRIAEAGLSCCY